VRYPAVATAWRDGFLIKMLALQYAALRRGAHSVVNVADVKIGTKKYPLLDWTIDGAQQVGFELARRRALPRARVPGRGNRDDKYEPLVVLRKG
jgi:hypothetical protein